MTRTSFVASCFAVAALALAPGLRAQTLRYGTQQGATHQYERTQKDHVVQTIQGNEQTADIESFWRFTTKVTDAGDAVKVAVVHDSLALSSPGITEQPDFSEIYGKPVEITMSKRGEVQNVDVPDSLPDIAARLDFGTTYKNFFPVLPAGEVETGDTWSDTLNTKSNQNGLDITVQRINDYTAKGMEQKDGKDAVRIEYVSNMKIEGTGNQQGADISLSGSGTGNGTFWFQPDPGTYLGGTEKGEMKMDAFVTAGDQNLMIPIVQSRDETVTMVE